MPKTPFLFDARAGKDGATALERRDCLAARWP
jgi:hypothetical protein